MEFRFFRRGENGRQLGVTAWCLGAPALMIASAPLGGGLGLRRWVLNAEVPSSYGRLDPAVHLAELAAGLSLHGPGVGLLTAVDVGHLQRSSDGGVQVAATVGLGHPVWAAAAPADRLAAAEPAPAGTVNIVAWVPVRLSDAALVNAVATATEAKNQALVGARVPRHRPTPTPVFPPR
ncbi:MAG: adenosylcobinamide amidohydrolase, partial [Acidimicrobiales bacterium]